MSTYVKNIHKDYTCTYTCCLIKRGKNTVCNYNSDSTCIGQVRVAYIHLLCFTIKIQTMHLNTIYLYTQHLKNKK